ncbi:uncharacterized protein LOC133723693 [Rosa rugosa]|uniref:Uncharacterized protein n=1 Tax=Rosa chinensis TaxID=74649 RepID=A0A2P6RC30_ROSCH|nr:uncharacterized protein LOC112191277 [Rosa chinensis]XP_062006552.1 uncharacterized protein LOC133723693 [Rosa rugosa]PRQ43984.1 hypothetical protein RchiOBHm_Chr3g0474201 [Rosa chinensis]
MASPKMKEAASKFPEGDADAELNPSKQKSVEVDPKASEVTSLQIKQRAEAEDNKRKEKKKEKNESVQKLKTTIVVSGVIVALIGAIFALTKKMREK